MEQVPYRFKKGGFPKIKRGVSGLFMDEIENIFLLREKMEPMLKEFFHDRMEDQPRLRTKRHIEHARDFGDLGDLIAILTLFSRNRLQLQFFGKSAIGNNRLRWEKG